MGIQKYRADICAPMPDNSVQWFAQWMGGDTLAKIDNCRIDGSDLRRTVYIQSEPDTYFSQPAACRIKGKTIKGYISGADDLTGCLIFHPMDSHKHLFSEEES